MANSSPQTNNLKYVAKNVCNRDSPPTYDELRRSEELYRTLMQCADDAMVVLNGDKVVDCNAATVRMFGGVEEDYIGKKPWEISPLIGLTGSPSPDRARKFVREAYAGNPVRIDWTHQNPDGDLLYLDVTLTRIDLSAGKRVLVLLRDVTEKITARQELERRVEFQSLMATISEGFITAQIDGIDERIAQALELIGNCHDLDRVSMWWLDHDDETVRRSHQWNLSGVTSGTMAIKFDMAPWSVKLVLSGAGFHVSSLDELPPEASGDRAILEREGATAMMFAPVTIDELTIGALSFVTMGREREWSKSVRKELQIIGRLIATAYQRHASLQIIRAHQAELERSQRVAEVGSFTETALPGRTLEDGFGISKMSAQACEIFDIEPGSETLELLISRIHPDDRQQFINVVNDAERHATEWSHDYRIVRTDGTIVYVEDRWEIDRNKNGEIIKTFGTVKDVTARVKAHADLTRALAKIRELKDQLHDENVYLRGEVRAVTRPARMVGENPRFKSVLAAVEKVAPTDVTVLILGETGTGKELVAREIHELSDRRTASMISVNCAALSSELIESELFGHESGAFTGAQKRRFGRFELADGGTLFLDEVGDLSLSVQAKILRVLQTGEFERLGGNATLNVDVRVIAATNRNLKNLVKDGAFRTDLFFRINSFPIELPPLRERLDDVSLLVNHFVDKYRENSGQHIESVSPQMIHYIQAREWPGNVRELESFIQRAMIACSNGVLDYTEQVENLDTILSSSGAVADRNLVDLDTVQEQHILSVLNECNWVIDGDAGAAASLGLPPSTLRSRMKRLGIHRPQRH